MTTNYLIWSFEHQAWWAPNRIGYTVHLRDAGRYSQADALEIVETANRYRLTIYEVAVPEAEADQWDDPRDKWHISD